jgi:hypothetical protein
LFDNLGLLALQSAAAVAAAFVLILVLLLPHHLMLCTWCYAMQRRTRLLS